MAANKNYRDGESGEKAPQTSIVRVCPSCGKTAHMSRKYCGCHADLRRASVTRSAALPAVGPCNFESPGLHCGDCPADCMYCASFAEPETNEAGFGGEACRHRTAGTERCSCCQFQVKLAAKLRGVEFSKIFSELQEENRKKIAENRNEWEENRFTKAASVIYDEMTQQIIARINREQEWAV